MAQVAHVRHSISGQAAALGPPWRHVGLMSVMKAKPTTVLVSSALQKF